jgi:hypothetical protein
MKKSILSIAVYIVCFYLVISIFSCNKENPIEPPPPPPPQQLDTASRFLWNPIPVGGPIFRIYVADTNSIYIETNGRCLHYNGQSFNYLNFQDAEFSLGCVSGYDDNNIFFAGTWIPENNVVINKLKKYTNGLFTTYILDTSTSVTSILKVTGQNQAWISTRQNYVYYFNDGIIIKYFLETDTLVRDPLIFNDKNNNLLIIAFNLSSTNRQLHVLRFNGNGFDLIRTDCFNNGDPNCLSDYIYQCGNDIIMSKFDANNELYYFDGNNWQYHSTFDSINIRAYKIGGWSKDSLVAICYQRNQFYTYNGKKWRYENGTPNILHYASGSTNVGGETKNSNVYFPYWDFVFGDSYLIIGKPNKKFNNLILKK